MTSNNSPEAQLRAENAHLRARLEEAEETLRAIRSGEVDSLVVETDEGPQIFSLDAAEAASNRFRGEILAQVSDSVIAVDREERITFFNVAAERQYGVRADEVLGRKISEIYTRHWPSPDAEAARWKALREHGEWRGETVQRLHDGREFHVESSLTLLRDASGAEAGMVAAIRDITERKRAEVALAAAFRESADLKAALDEHAIVATTDPQGKITFVNEKFCAISKYPREELLGQDHRIINSGHHPKAFFRDLWSTIARGRPWHGEIKNKAKDGSCYWVETTIVPFLNEEGKPRQYVAIRAEITERKEAEEQLRETIAELESYSYSISHDMRAPLRAMQSFAQILEEECRGQIGTQGREYIRRIVTAADRMDRLIQDVLVYSRVASTDIALENVDLAALLNGILEDYPQFQSPKAEITVAFPLPRVRGNVAALTQCLSNLVGNAVKFVAPGVVPHVKISAVTRDKRVRLSIQDNGIGIDPKMHGKIFGIFYRLSRDYEGTGIGLAVVRRAAERMGGAILVESELGKGSTFHLELNGASWE